MMTHNRLQGRTTKVRTGYPHCWPWGTPRALHRSYQSNLRHHKGSLSAPSPWAFSMRSSTYCMVPRAVSWRAHSFLPSPWVHTLVARRSAKVYLQALGVSLSTERPPLKTAYHIYIILELINHFGYSTSTMSASTTATLKSPPEFLGCWPYSKPIIMICRDIRSLCPLAWPIALKSPKSYQGASLTLHNCQSWYMASTTSASTTATPKSPLEFSGC